MMFLANNQALLVSDFGPKISFRIVDTLREEIRDGKLKSGAEIKVNPSASPLKIFQFHSAFFIGLAVC